jgi:hypothetical protein
MGTAVTGTFNTINWANGPYFLEVGMDITGSNSYVPAGISQLLSVPYALYAETSGSSLPGPTGPTGAAGTNGAMGQPVPPGLRVLPVPPALRVQMVQPGRPDRSALADQPGRRSISRRQTRSRQPVTYSTAVRLSRSILPALTLIFISTGQPQRTKGSSLPIAAQARRCLTAL